ncbi:MAG TPA: 5-oxoprolinase [Dehalococcoidia bacterium]|nr:5-oxoprolinase [Dehalococcoidia bacterium]
MANNKHNYIVGIDIGGTFTDIVIIRNNKLNIFKLPSTPSDPSIAVLKGIEELGVQDGEFVHGTTIATNTLLEKTGASTLLITTEGFKDIIEIGRQSRPDLYKFNIDKPTPLANPRERYGIIERVNKSGEIIEDLTQESISELLTHIESARPESIAVSLLFSFLNPAHEKIIQQAVIKKFPDVYLSVSSQIVPEFREFERTSTVLINSYVGPKVSNYLNNLISKLDNNLRVMQSSGGSISAKLASDEPVRTILSGPAGGVVGAFKVSQQAGINQIITIDMGGTSTDVSICPNYIKQTTSSNISGYPISIPMIEIHTVGAGGGSIANLNAGGALTVGPQSAGSDPGPVCYGKGENITVTDANVFLGRIQPDFFLGGTMDLDVDRCRTAINNFAVTLGLSPTDTALGIIKVVNANMEQAIRSISLERGYDPRDFALLPFGGAGSLHGCELADEIGMKTIFIPKYPGVLSALGVAIADVTKDYSRTVMLDSSNLDNHILEQEFAGMESNAKNELDAEKLPTRTLKFKRYLDIRYVGQSFELMVDYPAKNMKDSARFKAFISKSFQKLHQTRFGYSDPSQDIEIVNIRLKAILPSNIKIPEFNAIQSSNIDILEHRPVYFSSSEINTPIYKRDALVEGQILQGPALIVQFDTIIPVFPNWSSKADKYNNLTLTRE